ncbi:alpha/beta hydrolase [Microbulbifer sp. CAU 1566]|uniref:alpha/beta fold hydrolase n=1 Tax=Microbulbifer sp. CAU 1566 TaxID=2933269 RepID=UPI002003CACA|nr:alpha/beta hydrolase [Microbulbifer sp. CAU 1566]
MLYKILPVLIGSASYIAPRTIGQWAAKQIQVPRRKYKSQNRLPQADDTWQLEQGCVRRWGSKAEPVVLLIHGWEGHHSQLHSIASALRDNGYAVVIVEPPAHGDGAGERASPQHFADILNAAADIVGPIELLLGHSMGGLAATLAISQGLKTSHLVTISAPADAASTINGVSDWLRLSKPARQNMHDCIEEFAGIPIAQVDTNATLANYNGQHLILHDRNDRKIPVEHAMKIRNSNPSAVLVLTAGLGHTRLLDDYDLCIQILNFTENRLCE